MSSTTAFSSISSDGIIQANFHQSVLICTVYEAIDIASRGDDTIMVDRSISALWGMQLSLRHIDALSLSDATSRHSLVLFIPDVHALLPRLGER